MPFDPFSAFLDGPDVPAPEVPAPEAVFTPARFSSEVRVASEELERPRIDLVEYARAALDPQVQTHQEARIMEAFEQNIPLEAIWGQDPEGPMFPPNPEPEEPADIDLDEGLVAEVFRPRDVPEDFQALTDGPEDAFPVEFDAGEMIDSEMRTSPNEAVRFQVGRTDPPRRTFGRQIQHQDGVEVSRRVADSGFQAINRPAPRPTGGASGVVAQRNPQTGRFESTVASLRGPSARPSRPQVVTARAEVKTDATPPPTLLERVAGPDWF
jgi:hypothetical protein